MIALIALFPNPVQHGLDVGPTTPPGPTYPKPNPSDQLHCITASFGVSVTTFFLPVHVAQGLRQTNLPCGMSWLSRFTALETLSHFVADREAVQQWQ